MPAQSHAPHLIVSRMYLANGDECVLYALGVVGMWREGRGEGQGPSQGGDGSWGEAWSLLCEGERRREPYQSRELGGCVDKSLAARREKGRCR